MKINKDFKHEEHDDLLCPKESKRERERDGERMVINYTQPFPVDGIKKWNTYDLFLLQHETIFDISLLLS